MSEAKKILEDLDTERDCPVDQKWKVSYTTVDGAKKSLIVNAPNRGAAESLVKVRDKVSKVSSATKCDEPDTDQDMDNDYNNGYMGYGW